MNRLILGFFFASLLSPECEANPVSGQRPILIAAKKKIKKRKKKKVVSTKKKRGSKRNRIRRAIASTKRVGQNALVHRYRANFALGVNVIRGESALLIGSQFGYAFWEDKPIYFGPELNFSLNTPQSLLEFLVGGWYQLRIYRTPRMGLSGGALVGVAVPSSHNIVRKASPAYFVDIAISQEVDDLASVRGQFRPGFVGENFSFMMNFNVSFRFP